MARQLRRTVITGGVTYPAGTPWTAALEKKIPNPVAWEGEPDAEEMSAPKAKSSARKRTAAKVSTETKAPVEDSTPDQGSSDEDSTPDEGSSDEDSTPDEGSSDDDSTPDEGSSDDDSTPEAPPRNGAGSTTEAWAKHATDLGIEVPEGAGRDEIVALVDAR